MHQTRGMDLHRVGRGFSKTRGRAWWLGLVVCGVVALAPVVGAQPRPAAKPAPPAARTAPGPAMPAPGPTPAPGPRPSPYCQGHYASEQIFLAPEARQLEEKTRYTFCIRSTATYHCLFYGPDGALQGHRVSASAHGTGFAFRRDGSYTYFLTNEHVVEWPFVTGSGAAQVEGIPRGCKRVVDSLTIVDSEHDTYTKDDIPLQRVVVDKELDTAVLKAAKNVAVIPFGFGQSAALKVGDAVRVRGFPLGAFQAVQGGKVISPREPDQERGWDHYDFVTDAQLSQGSSGSPVLAVNCATRSFELVGIYHAAYKHGQSLNVVVGIDDFRDLITTLKPRKKRKASEPTLTAADRQQLLGKLRRGAVSPIFSFGGAAVGIRVVDTRLLYDVYAKKFPLVDWRVAVLEDLPAQHGFGRVGRLWFGNELGLLEKAFSDLKPSEQNTVANLVESIRVHFKRVQQYRQYEPLARKSRVDHDRLRALDREMNRGATVRTFHMRALLEIADLYDPSPNDKVLPVSATTTTPKGWPVPGAPPPGTTRLPPGKRFGPGH
jgi:S1-C subfamily serine protease